MRLKVQKRLAAEILKTSKKNIRFEPERLEDVKEAITKTDIRGLIAENAIKARHAPSTSRSKTRKTAAQRKKGLQKGFGSRKGKKGSRMPKKEKWMIYVRLQREFIKSLKEKKLISNESYRNLYRKIKGGFFRNKRHIKLYLDEHKMIEKKNGKA